ncbi:MAG: HlyD family efflux transporter periplasmic adaptor subunit [Planctomycetota bacterium]|nr:HlyD family efflux transporter periplasmic adaptor subunit [Planctomycetota bacterium]
MAEAEKSAVSIGPISVQEVKHTMKAARLLYSAPPIILRGPIYMVFLISIGAVAYACVSKVSSIVTCPVVLVKDETKIQAPTGGIVSRISVVQGNKFETLTNLVDIQFKTMATTTSEGQDLQDQLDRLMEKKARIEEGGEKIEQRVAGLRSTLKALEEKLPVLTEENKKENFEFEAQLREQENRYEIVKKQFEQAQNDVVAKKKLVETRKDAVKDAEKALNDEQELFKKQQSTVLQVQAMKDQLRGAQEALVSLQAALDAAEKDVAKLDLTLLDEKAKPDRLRNQHERSVLERNSRKASLEEQISQTRFQIAEMELTKKQDLETIKKDIDRLRDQIKESGTLTTNYKFEGELCRVYSPYGGTVTQVYVKPGQQINGGDVMLSVIKDTEAMYARVLVPNRDIGRLKEGIEVKIKFDAYPYQEFGSQTGHIMMIANTPSNKQGEESFYEVKVSLEKGTIKVGAKDRPLTIGLVGLADIKTGDKRLIEVIFTPISKFFGSDE